MSACVLPGTVELIAILVVVSGLALAFWGKGERPALDGWVHFEPKPDLTASELLFALEAGFGKPGGARKLPCNSATAFRLLAGSGAERHFRWEPVSTHVGRRREA